MFLPVNSSYFEFSVRCVNFCCFSSLIILFAVRLVSGTDVADISWRRSYHYNYYHW